jgi:cation diffusion facilitator CzcD-associated flavoprotein CzcO
MATERFGAKPLQYIPAEVMHNYFEAYAQEFGIDRHLRLSTKVLSAEHQDDGGWLLEIKNEESELPTRVFAKRLIVATGQDSEPLMPHIRGQEQYNRPLFHSRDFQKYKDTVNTAKSVTVFGGTKSGWDAVYAYATHGAQVDWIIRRKYRDEQAMVCHGPLN